ncbi:hypothetical protein PFISCL1PPCAC_21021, partial [Pristionchus fissidentatus]
LLSIFTKMGFRDRSMARVCQKLVEIEGKAGKSDSLDLWKCLQMLIKDNSIQLYLRKEHIYGALNYETIQLDPNQYMDMMKRIGLSVSLHEACIHVCSSENRRTFTRLSEII